MSSDKVCVLAGGAYGTALAVAIAARFAYVSVWQVDALQAADVESRRENLFFLPGVKLAENVHFTSSLCEAVHHASFILSAIPTQPLSAFLNINANLIPLGVPVISCSKGVTQDTGLFPYELWERAVPKNPVSILSGPSFAKELAAGFATAVTIYGQRSHNSLWVDIAKSMSTSSLRVFVSDDIVGAAVMGAAKNVLAILAGGVLGENARALVIALGLKGLRSIAKSLGSDGEAALGMAGVGDVVLTCNSEESRNYSLGKLLGSGVALEDAVKQIGLAEGLATVSALRARVGNQNFPILEAVKKLVEGRGVDEALQVLLNDTIYE